MISEVYFFIFVRTVSACKRLKYFFTAVALLHPPALKACAALRSAPAIFDPRCE